MVLHTIILDDVDDEDVCEEAGDECVQEKEEDISGVVSGEHSPHSSVSQSGLNGGGDFLAVTTWAYIPTTPARKKEVHAFIQSGHHPPHACMFVSAFRGACTHMRHTFAKQGEGRRRVIMR